MLASTVQFSTYDQPPIHRCRQPSGKPPKRYARPTGPDTETTVARSLRTQQRAYDPPASDHLVPRTTTVAPYWKRPKPAGRTSQRSTLEHHPAHPPTPTDEDRSRHGRGLHHPTPHEKGRW